MLKEMKGNLITLGFRGEFDVIVHGCNCFHIMGGGIAREVRARIPEAYEADKRTIYGDPSKLGLFSFAEIKTRPIREGVLNYAPDEFHSLTVVNAYTQYHISAGEDVFEYDALKRVLQRINHKFPGKRVGIPLIGCGLAGGDEGRIRAILEEAAQWMDLTLVVFQP